MSKRYNSGLSLSGVLEYGEKLGVSAMHLEAVRRSVEGRHLSLADAKTFLISIAPEKRYRVIYRAWKRGADGRKMWARDYGHVAWPIRIRVNGHEDSVTSPAGIDIAWYRESKGAAEVSAGF